MGNSASNPLLACCCPEDDETRLLREEEMRRDAAETRERVAMAASQRQTLFDQSAHGKAAAKSQAAMRKQASLEDKRAEERVRDWNS
mmetsp:Transcript_9660/g.23899  ORF Transcript_9660/g.23899 Transcript_9660/m.23899 type:complete len:87 (+) Transcript_9660:50-310(+)|eukprot:CAMPEP_0197617334 /NCGR_PEP_ID=MMETSP1326-20131121/60982_1 /TAXON_ID=1155430 /ORGANISM="Genus nov. species nov., Strain RCC2288" /LENGTH=86 /DNA_ID=CAMNT_0043186225 /DNA_START=16 /DNA_END=276 /DNA_ORIENTATION=-